MSRSSFIRLILLAAIWGSSFLFMRIAAPVLGAVWVAELRLVLGALFLATVGLYLSKKLEVGKYWRHYLTLGLFDSAIPFLLFAWAAQTLSASLLAILNATAPIWGAAIASVIGRQPLTARILVGLSLGAIGVTILVGFDMSVSSPHSMLAVTAVLGASFCYGIASNYAFSAPAVGSFNNASGSIWASVLLLLPVMAFFPVAEIPNTGIVSAVFALGVICSGVAYLIYFRLIEDEGATSALSVTFLVPVFGVLWGYIFLDEAIGWHTLTGAAVVLAGIVLVTGLSLRTLRGRIKPLARE